MKKKVFVIGGTTASNKSDIAVKLALLNNDEIVSCDSRQVYKELNISSGKLTKAEMLGVKHHMLDVVSINDTASYTAFKFKNEARAKIEEVHNKGKLPILIGGTGFYIDSILCKKPFSDIPPNHSLRTKLEKLSEKELIEYLKNHNADTANLDTKNKTRMIRYIEMLEHSGCIPKTNKTYDYEVCYIKLIPSQKTLYSNIEKRLNTRWEGIKTEAKKLQSINIPNERLFSLGLECAAMSKLNTTVEEEDVIKAELFTKIKQYAKRQKTWFKRIDGEVFEPNEYDKIEKLFIQFRSG